MTENTAILLKEAEEAKYYANIGAISIEEAKKRIKPYIDAVNEKAIEIAKNYNMKPKKISISHFMRQ